MLYQGHFMIEMIYDSKDGVELLDCIITLS
jgi:hypothetical protein